MELPWKELLRQLEEAHRALAVKFTADEGVVNGLSKVREGLAEEARLLGADLWDQEPEPGEWSLRRMLVHLVEHDLKTEETEELRVKGVSHYVDHGRVHVEQASKIRRLLKGV